MPWELIFTSAPRGLIPGRKGYCTVAHTEGIPEEVLNAVETLGVYHHLGNPGSSANPTVYSHRIIDIRGRSYHVVSRIRDCGLDYTQRSNYIAHHLIFDPSEVGVYASPAAILEQWPGWKDQWGEIPPRLLPAAGLESLSQIQHRLGPAQTWAQICGDAAASAALMARSPAGCMKISVKPGEEKFTVSLFAEALQLADPTGQSLIEGWTRTFTTYLQEGEVATDFCWCGCIEGTPAYNAALSQGSVECLENLSAPEGSDPRCEVARTGKPAPAQAPAQETISQPIPMQARADTGQISEVPVENENIAQAYVSRERERVAIGEQKAENPYKNQLIAVGAVAGLALLVVAGFQISPLFENDDNGGYVYIPPNGSTINPDKIKKKPPDKIKKKPPDKIKKKPPDKQNPIPVPVAPPKLKLAELYEKHVYLMVKDKDGLQKQFDAVKMKEPLEALLEAMERHVQKCLDKKIENTEPLSGYELYVAKNMKTLLNAKKSGSGVQIKYNHDGFDPQKNGVKSKKIYFISGAVQWEGRTKDKLIPKVGQELSSNGGLMYFKAKDQTNSFHWFIFEKSKRAPIEVEYSKKYLDLDVNKKEIRLGKELRKFLHRGFRLSPGKGKELAFMLRFFSSPDKRDYELPIKEREMKKEWEKQEKQRKRDNKEKGTDAETGNSGPGGKTKIPEEIRGSKRDRKKKESDLKFDLKDFWDNLRKDGAVLYLSKDKEHIPLIKFK